ncbi:MAG: GumC family protein [Gemmobacter sp.]
MSSSLRETSGAAAPAEPAELIADLAAAILRRWALVLFVTLALVGVVYAVMQTRPDTYRIEARLLVKVGPENLEMPTTVSRGALVSNGVRKEDINSDVILLESRHLIEHAVDTIGLDAFRIPRPEPQTVLARLRRAASDAVSAASRAAERVLIDLRLAQATSERDKLILRIDRNLQVRREGESDVIVMTLTFGNGPLGVRILNTMIEQFLIDRATARRSIGTVAFFEEQAQRALAQVVDLDARIAALRVQHGVTSIAEERKLLLEQSAAVSAAIVAAEQARASVQPIRHFADLIDPARAAAMTGGAPYKAVLDSIGDLMVRRTAEIGAIAASGRAAQEIEERIGALVLLLERSVADEVALREAERARLAARLGELNVAEQALLLLLSERETMQTRYDDNLVRLEEERVNTRLEESRVANIAILTPPMPPIAPSGPPRLAISLVSLPLGLVLGIALAGMLGYADRRLFAAHELTRLPGVVVLGEMSRAELRA